MAQGQTTRNNLSLRDLSDPNGAFREIKRWADRLPLGSTGFRTMQDNNAQVILTGTNAKITFDTPLIDNERWTLPTPTAQTDFTVPPGLSGMYVINAEYIWTPAAARVFVVPQVNGLAIAQTDAGVVAGVADRIFTTMTFPLRDGDVLTLTVVNSSGGNITTVFAAAGALVSPRPMLSAWRISLL